MAANQLVQREVLEVAAVGEVDVAQSPTSARRLPTSSPEDEVSPNISR